MRKRWLPFLLSFSVYLIPLVGPHAVWLLGTALAGELTRPGEREPLWIAADFGTALALQVAAGALFAWFFRKPRWSRTLVLLASAPAFVAAAHGIYLLALPTYFLIEPDRERERSHWTVECTVRDAWVAQVRSPAGLALERAGEAVLHRSDGAGTMLLRAPGCAQTNLDVRFSSTSNLWVVPGGGFLHQSPDGAWYAGSQKLQEPPGASKNDGPPILSNDSAWVAWIVRPPAALLRSLRDSSEMAVNLAQLSPASFVPVELDMSARRLTVVRNEREMFDVDVNGNPERIVMDLGQVRPLSNTMRRIASGWVAWDGYRDSGSYLVAWSLAQGKGTHSVPKGRLIHSVAVDPDGRFIAISVGGALSIGGVRDSIYVLRASDGAEVFRKYLPRYTRTQVAFLGSGFLAYTQSEGTRSEVRVLRVP